MNTSSNLLRMYILPVGDHDGGHPLDEWWSGAAFNLSLSVTDNTGETTVVSSDVRIVKPSGPFIR